jgi:predicted dehydrogenase
MHEAINAEKPDGLIVTVGFTDLFSIAMQLIPYGIPMLLEKPGSTSWAEHQKLKTMAEKYGNKVQMAVNRRFYSVFNKAIEDAGGLDHIITVNIEWSERPKMLLERGMSRDEIAKIIFGNSVHGIDMLSWIAGGMHKTNIYTRNLGEPFRWYMHADGISGSGVLYSFHSSWDHPVPWRMTLGTKNKRYVFAPLEQCQVLEEGMKEYFIEPDEPDKQLKPGFHGQAKAFLDLIAQGKNAVPVSATDASMKLCEAFYNELS